ncbi:MAG: DNA repair protein RecN [Lachnospiraceae bacterium]|nr:DNA repair protein RecN [Lachnospiraceae bacterium]
MLVNLHVKNLAIIDEIEIDFSEKMNVLTGETGAGKSIIIGSVNLALGQKTPKDIIRKGAEYALAEMVFRIDSLQQQEILEEMGISPEENEIVISRKITQNRSVNRINGESVTLAMIRRVADVMIDIHGQNEQQSLLHMSKHMEIVDRYARDRMGDRLEQMAKNYQEYQKLSQELAESEIPEEERLREVSFMQYELEEIRQAHLVPGEEEALEQQFRTLSNASGIAQGLGEIYGMTGEGSSTASEQLNRSLRILHRLSEYSPRMEEFSEQLSEIDSLLTDFNRDISGYMEDFETGEEQLAQVESRLNQVRMIKSKYGATTSQVKEYAHTLEEKLARYEEYEEYRNMLEKQLAEKEETLERLSEEISQIRKKVSKTLEKEITKALKDLNFLQVQFEIAVRPTEQFSAHGKDEIEFMLSTNPGMDKKPLGQAASGGELSRIMLAVKAVLAQHDEIPTLIFDEIDVGISGRTAQMVAEKMAYIGDTHQVICISHLAQIAAMADTHYLIEKKNEKEHTSTQIRLLDQKESIEELARISGGVEITDSVRESAAEMKQMAQEVKKKLRG